jgi:gliding motility-associated-like protein
MNPIRTKIQPKPLLAVVIAVFFSVNGNAQTKPDNNTNFGVPGVGGSIASGVKMISSVESGLPFTFSYVSPVGTTGSVIYVGQPSSGGLFRPSNSAIFFNYTYSSGNVIPGAAVGATGTGDYRLHFTQPNPSDTGANKLGNFGLSSMYIAIGAGNTADITVSGFRAGRMMAQGVITGLSSNNGSLSSMSPVDLFYSGSDQYSGVTVSFGSNWQFLDGITFTIGDKNIPLNLDDINFNDPSNTSPATQASAVNFTTTTGIISTVNWTKGTGDRHAVFMKAANSGVADISQGVSYTANTVFGSGTTTAGGWTCVYNAMDNGGGATGGVNVTNLTPGTTYMVMVVSYNGSGSYCTYNTSSNPGGTVNTTNFATIAIPTTQASSITVTPNYTDFRRASITWTRGNGAKSAVFVKNNTPGQTVSSTVAPSHNDNNNTQHSYSAVVDSMSVTANGKVGSTGWYCVYNNAGSGTGLSATVSMTRITVEPNQTLRVMVVEYNGSAGAETYNTTSVSSNVIDYVVPNRPLPVTETATNITTSAATMNGTITPRNGNITSGTFTYSNDPSLIPVLGTVAVTPAANTIAGSALTTTVSGALTALTPSTTYYYRLAAISNANTGGAAVDKGSIPASILSFTTVPVVSSVSATTANGYYKAGEVITISVTFTAAVTVTGTPTIALNSSGSASYISGSGSAVLLFAYTIGAGQVNADLDYISVSALAGGTIKDAGNNDASIVLPAPGSANSMGGQKDIVVDTQTPQVNTVTIASSHTNTALAKAGDVITINFTSNEPVVTPTATIAGNAVSATNSGGNNWSAVYTMAGTDADGVIVFSIPFTDVAHNDGATVTGTTNSSSVKFDKTIPLLPAVTIASNNANTALARVGEVVTISFTSSEAIFTPTATISGNTATISNMGGNNWTASYTMVTGDAGGAVSFSVLFTDITGNTGVAVTATTDNSAIRFDKTIPLLSTVTIASNNTNTALSKPADIVTVSFTSNEAVFTPTVTIAGHTAAVSNTGGNNWTASYTMTNTDADGNIPFVVSFIDISGNTGTTVTTTTNNSTIRFDKIIPSLSIVTLESNNVNSAISKPADIVMVSFTSNEAVFTPTVTIAGHTAAVSNTSGNNWTASYTMTNTDADGNIPFVVSFIDISGNAGTTVTTTTNNSTIRFDKTIPFLSTVTLASNNVNSAISKPADIVTVSFTSNEAVFTPAVTIAGHTAAVNNTSGNNWTASYTMTNTDTDGNISFVVSFIDISGNAGTTVTTTTNNSTIRFDKTIPLLSTVTIASNNANSAISKPADIVTVSFTSSEAVFTPAVTIAGHTAAVNNTSGNSWTASYTMTNADTDGNIPFAVSFIDVNGNAGTTVTATTNSGTNRFDKTAPLLTPVTITSNNTNNKYAKTGNTVTLRFTGSETLQLPVVTLAGHTVAVTSTGANNWAASYTMASSDTIGNVAFSVAFKDLAGNNGVIGTATSNNSNVLFESRLPLLTTVKITSGNSVDSLAKPGDLVTLSFTSDRTIMVPLVTMAGRAATITNVNGNNWIAATAMNSSDKESYVPFAIGVTDLAGNAVLSLTTTSDTSRVLFDQTSPTVISIVRQSPLSATVATGTTSVIFRVTFSETVKNVTPAAFVLTTGGVTTGTITSVSAASGTKFDVTVNEISGSGSIRLDLKNAGTNIIDAAGNAASGGFGAGERYNVIVNPVSFANTTPALSLCVGTATAFSLGNLLMAGGGDNGQPVRWTIIANALHGTLNGFPATATINTPPTLPTGLTYLPVSGYIGNDAFTIQVSNGYDSVTTVVNVRINASPVAAISSAQGTALCGAATLALTASGGTNYTWYNNGSLVPNATTSQLVVSAAGTYNAIATDATGCTGGLGNSLVIEQFQKPTLDFAFDSYCVNKGVMLTNKSVVTNSGAVTYAWTDGTNTAAGTSAVFTYAQTGAQNVKLTVTPVACPSLADNITKTVAIEAPVAALRMPTQNVAANTPVPLQARTVVAGNTYAWLPLTGLSAPGGSLTDAAISKEQQYLISITAPSGCVAVDTILLRIFVANTILLPNVFSPNGDGQNDKILPNLVGVKTFFYLRIFNRAGKKVFETHNAGDGWDGKLNGVPQPVDTYFWSASGTDKNGLPIGKQGTFTLVR